MCSRFSTKEAATHAIEAMHNAEINGQQVKCFWGKESSDPATAQNAQQPQQPQQSGSSVVAANTQPYPYPAYAEVGYWYPPGTYQAPPVTAAAQMPGQYLQNVQPHYAAAYGQFPYQPQGAYRVVPAGWQGIPAPVAGAPPPQPMMAYTMSQFQAQ